MIFFESELYLVRDQFRSQLIICNINIALINIRILIIIIIIVVVVGVDGKSVFKQLVSWAKTRDMESQDKLYSFFGDRDRGGGGHISVMRRGSRSGGWAVLFFTNDLMYIHDTLVNRSL